MKRVITMLIAGALAGCATAAPMIWDKPGGNQAGFNQDNAQCAYEAKQGTPNTPNFRTSDMLVNAVNDANRHKELFMLCMAAKGYTLRQKPA